MSETRLTEAASLIADCYARVASGESRGAGGLFAADGKGTLVAVLVPVELMEDLARALGRQVLPRTREARQ